MITADDVDAAVADDRYQPGSRAAASWVIGLSVAPDGEEALLERVLSLLRAAADQSGQSERLGAAAVIELFERSNIVILDTSHQVLIAEPSVQPRG
ncbi:MAG: hypothetical protein M3Y09_14270 [Actinomycetota bacterium]|nr:hypothetical protein [Actinomycetota bacterium]